MVNESVITVGIEMTNLMPEWTRILTSERDSDQPAQRRIICFKLFEKQCQIPSADLSTS